MNGQKRADIKIGEKATWLDLKRLPCTQLII